MGLVKYLRKVVKALKWYDLSLIKGTVFFATLFLITVWPAFHGLVMRIDWYWYLLLTVVFGVPVMRKMF